MDVFVEALRNFLNTYGQDAMADSRRVKAALLDAKLERPKANIVAMAIEEGLLTQIENCGQLLDMLAMERASEWLQLRLPIEADLARWLVQTLHTSITSQPFLSSEEESTYWMARRIENSRVSGSTRPEDYVMYTAGFGPSDGVLLEIPMYGEDPIRELRASIAGWPIPVVVGFYSEEDEACWPRFQLFNIMSSAASRYEGKAAFWIARVSSAELQSEFGNSFNGMPWVGAFVNGALVFGDDGDIGVNEICELVDKAWLTLDGLEERNEIAVWICDEFGECTMKFLPDRRTFFDDMDGAYDSKLIATASPDHFRRLLASTGELIRNTDKSFGALYIPALSSLWREVFRLSSQNSLLIRRYETYEGLVGITTALTVQADCQAAWDTLMLTAGQKGAVFTGGWLGLVEAMEQEKRSEPAIVLILKSQDDRAEYMRRVMSWPGEASSNPLLTRIDFVLQDEDEEHIVDDICDHLPHRDAETYEMQDAPWHPIGELNDGAGLIPRRLPILIALKSPSNSEIHDCIAASYSFSQPDNVWYLMSDFDGGRGTLLDRNKALEELCDDGSYLLNSEYTTAHEETEKTIRASVAESCGGRKLLPETERYIKNFIEEKAASIAEDEFFRKYPWPKQETFWDSVERCVERLYKEMHAPGFES